MKKNGFTLIELIAVVVIMGILLLIVFPSLSSIIRSNENKKYDTYYDAVKEQIELYARTRRNELGGIEGSGCVDDINLLLLKQYDYITEFDNKKVKCSSLTDYSNADLERVGCTNDSIYSNISEIECKSPNEFSNAELESLGINTDNQYVNIRIENNKGRINVDYSMICIKHGKRKPEYTNLILKTKNCENYVPVVSNSLINALNNNISNSNIETINNDNYLKGNVLNNYVWYSGKMWRIVSFNTNNKTIKLVTDDNVSLLTYNTLNNEYRDSKIYYWLSNTFLQTLRNSNQYLTTVDWNYSNVSSNVSEQITGGNTINSNIGLLNNFEYNIGKDFLNKNKNFWLISTTNNNKAWYVNNSGNIVDSNVNESYGVRPSIVLKAGITYVNGGNGTESNPYKLTGDISANPNTPLNTRFSGEYVTLNGELYRISSVNANYTKLILDRTLDIEKQFHYFDTKYSKNTYIGIYLDENWIPLINDYLKNGDFCREEITKAQTVDCDSSDLIGEINVAIPKIGEMFTNESNYEYWTLTNFDEEKICVLTTEGTINAKTIEQNSHIRPVIVVDNSIVITGGNGTKNSPYTIGKNE